MAHLDPRIFDIWVVGRGLPGSYRVSASTGRRGQRAVADVSFDPTVPPLAELSTLLAGPTTAAQLREIGAALFDRLIVGDVRSLFLLALGEALGRKDTLRVILEIEPSELAVLPWEMLYFAEHSLFLAISAQTTLSRTLSLFEPVRSLAVPETLKVLLLLPRSSRLDTRKEKAAVERFRAARGGRAEIAKIKGKVTQEAIRRALRDHEVHLVHFAGHGVFRDGEAAVLLDGKADRPERMTASSFADLFLDSPSVGLIVLNACQGAVRSSIEALAGVVPELLRRGIPAVIAMQSPVVNSEATRFAGTFYAELAGGFDPGSIEAALARARGAMLQERPDSPAFASPVLYLRAPDGNLWRDVGPDRRMLAEAVRRNAERVRKGLEPYILTRISRKEVGEKYLPAIRSSLAERRGRIIPILGSAGFGKSTLLGEIFDRLQAESPSWLALVDSGELAGSGTGDLAVALGRAACGIEISIVELAAALERVGGPGVLLIDTLDLILGPDLLASLQRLLFALGETATTVVFTCRDHDYQLQLEPPRIRLPQVADRVDRYSVPLFTLPEVAEAARLFVATDSRLAGTAVGYDFAERILSLSADSRSIQEITCNPLLLAMLCDLFGEAGDVPRDLTIGELYDRHWNQKVERSRIYAPSSPELLEKSRLCLKLAEHLLDISQDRLRESAAESDLDLTITAPLAGAREELLSEGVLKRQSSGWLRFFHQTFLEYAMARWLVTRAGTPARERLLGRLRSSGEGSAHLYLWPVLRQLLMRLDDDDFATIVGFLPRDGLAAFRTLGLVAVARYDAKLLSDLLARAIVLGSEYQKTLCLIVEGAPPRLAESAWQVIQTVLLAGDRDAALLAAQTAGPLLSRRQEAIGARLGELLACIDRRMATQGGDVEGLDLRGQLIRGCLPILEESGEPEALALVRDRYFSFGFGIRSALLTLFSSPRIPTASREEFVAVVMSQPPGKGLVPELTGLLEQSLRSRHPERSENLSIILHNAVPSAWETIHGRAVARLLAGDEALIVRALRDVVEPDAQWLRRSVNVLLETIEMGYGQQVGQSLLSVDFAGLPAQRGRILASLVTHLGEAAQGELRLALALWLQPMIEREPGEALSGFAAVADASEPTWRRLVRGLQDLLEQGKNELARKVVEAVPLSSRSRLVPELEGFAGQHPHDSTRQMILVHLLASQAANSEPALAKLCDFALKSNKAIALAASNALSNLAGFAEHPSPSELLPLAESPFPGVRDYLLQALLALREAGRELTDDELSLLCQGFREESNLSTLKVLCTFLGAWIRDARRVPSGVAEMLAGTPQRLGDRMEAGIARALIRALKILAQLEDLERLASLAEAARSLLLGIDLSRLDDGESEMIDLLSAISRQDAKFLATLLEVASGLFPRNLRALAAAIKRVEGEGSPLLSDILEAEWCPPAARRMILEIRGI